MCGKGLRPELKAAVVYGAAAFSTACLNNIWVTYNYPHYARGVLSSGPWFVIVQLLFMVWNTVNDSLFGWFSDNARASEGMSALDKRLPRVRWGGFFLSVAFALSWFRIPSSEPVLVACHFLLVLFLYDGALTLVEVNHASLMADLPPNTSLRVACNAWSSVCSIGGVLTLAGASMMWDSTEEASRQIRFRTFCVFAAILAFPGFEITARFFGNLSRDLSPANSPAGPECPSRETDEARDNTPVQKRSHVRLSNGHAAECNKDKLEDAPGVASEQDSSMAAYREFLIQLSSQPNFSRFCGVRLLQVFSCTFEKNHLALFLPLLFKTANARGISALISLTFVLPHLGVFAVHKFVAQAGVYRALGIIWVSKLVLFSCILTMLIFYENSYSSFLVAMYMCFARVATELCCRLFPVVVSELVDEDRMLNRRHVSRAASVVGTSAMFAKPGESLAPIMGWWLLSLTSGSLSEDSRRHPKVLWVVLAIPAGISMLQLFLWRAYSLHGSYLKQVQQHLADLQSMI